MARLCRAALATVLFESGDFDSARSVCVAAMARSREAGDLIDLATMLTIGAFLEDLAGNPAQARTYLHEALVVAARTGDHLSLVDCIQECGFLCAATGSPAQLRAAEDRGSRMTLAAAAEFATMLTAPREATAADAASQLSARERELVTLVARGHTNTQIAERLHISVRTVASHLDRIRDKTGHRRRADLTRLALEEKLV